MSPKRLLWTLIATVAVAYGGLLTMVLTKTHPALGLDLQGGLSVTLAPKESGYSNAAFDITLERIRERVDSLGVAEPEILRQGDTIVVNLPGVKNQKQALDLAKISGKVYLRPVLGCREIPRTTEDTVPGDSVPGGSVPGSTPGSVTGAVVGGSVPAGSTPGGAVSSSSVAAPSGFRARSASSVPAAPPSTTPATSVAPPTTIPATTAVPGSTPDTTPTTTPPRDPNSVEVIPVRPSETISGGFCQVGPQQGEGTVFDGDSAQATIQPGEGWTVIVDLKDGAAGADIWNRLAAQCYSGSQSCPPQAGGRGQLAIELDGEIISHPSVNVPRFERGVTISGSFKESEARQLAQVLQSGALPMEIKTEAVQTVSPTLGKDSLHAALIAGAVGIGLVLLFMMFYYRHLGLIAAAGLSISGAALYAIISLLSRTQGLALSLAGVAGVVVSVGVTVDSYVVFFERLKDEVRAGRSLRNSAKRGFHDSWRTILIADLVSLIGALVLWYLTVGSVRNFAFFLGLSTLIDLVVAWFFTRPAVMLLARTEWMQKRKVMGIEVAEQGAAQGGGR